MFFHCLTYLFLFCIVLTEKYKIIKAIEDDFYDKVIEVKCSRNFKLKAGYTAEEKRVWRFSVNKNYCIKDIINKISGEKEKKITCTNINSISFISYYVFKRCAMHYRSGRTEVFCVKAVIKTL